MGRECHKDCWWMELNGIKISKFSENVIRKYDENSALAFILDVNLPILPRKMKMKENEKFVRVVKYKRSYIAYIRNLKQALNDGLILEKV